MYSRGGLPAAPLSSGGGGTRNFGTDQSAQQAGHELGYRSPANPLNTPVMSPAKGHLPRGSGFFSSDDTALAKQILGIHAPDMEDLNVKPVLAIVEDILRLGRPLSTDTAIVGARLDPLEQKKAVVTSFPDDKKALHGSYRDDKSYHSLDHDSETIRILVFPISRISSEIICKCSAGGDAHSATLDILRSLTNYSWDAKVAITFAAFAISYGEFWLVEHFHTKDPLAKNIGILKDLPQIMESATELNQKFEAVINLLHSALNVTHCIVEFKDLPSLYISHESPEISAATAHIPTAVYWIIRSLMASASVLLNLVGGGHEYMTSTSESWEILSLTHKLSVILEHLKKQLAICLDLVGKKKAEDAYLAFKKLIETSHIDNMKVLRAMIRSTEDQRPLFDGTKRTNERLETLRSKYVLLLISDLDVPHEEINVMHMIYSQQTMRHEYEVLWLPIVHPAATTASSQDNVFYDLRNTNMPWYSVDHPSLVEPVAIRYIKEVWNFTHMPMLVVLDPQGKPSNINALPMMWIWGSNAFPFTKAREHALWEEHTWNIELLADSIDPRIPEWIKGNRVICLYGGENIDWIRKFTGAAHAAANALRVPLEMLYVGKRNPRDKVKKCHEAINKEKLSHIFSLNDYYDYIWYFWVRLWSMWNSKKHIGMSVDNDRIMQEIMDVLTFDSSKDGWAVFSRGNHEITKGNGDIVYQVFQNYGNWAYKVDYPEKFVTVLDEEIKGVHPEHHCNHLILPGQTDYIPERVVCSQCGKVMEKYVMYSCCND